MLKEAEDEVGRKVKVFDSHYDYSYNIISKSFLTPLDSLCSNLFSCFFFHKPLKTTLRDEPNCDSDLLQVQILNTV